MNPEITLTLDDAVQEVLGNLTGLDLTYRPEFDRYYAVTRQLNRALRANALEKEWSYYSSVLELGPVTEGQQTILLTVDSTRRPRIINDDAVRLVDDDGNPLLWAYFLPRDALHKYRYQPGMWCSVTGDTLSFSKPFTSLMAGNMLHVPVMREPLMFRLPAQPEDPNDPIVTVPPDIRTQELDFAYPDIIVARAAYYYAQTDPVMQPRVQTLEGLWKDLMYQALERDDQNTDSPYENDFIVPVQNGLYPEQVARPWPLADRRR